MIWHGGIYPSLLYNPYGCRIVHRTKREDPPPEHIQAAIMAKAEAKRQRRRERNLRLKG